jgi:hypothetical protein
VATLKEFEEELRAQGMRQALRILERLRERDRAKRKVAAPRRIAGVKMTQDLALRILELHKTTSMTQQEIAFELGVNQGRVNEVIKRGKWLTDDPEAPERLEADKAVARMRRAKAEPKAPARPAGATPKPRAPKAKSQLSLF